MEDIRYKISLKNELIRKSIHILSSVIAFFYLLTDYKTTVIVLSVITFLMILIDIFRLKIRKFNDLYTHIFSPILRKHELSGRESVFTGGTYIIIGYFLCVLIFPKEIAVTSMFIAAYSDTAAAIVGKVYGKMFVKSKTVEGSIAFFLVGIAVIFFSPKYTGNPNEIYIALMALFITTLYELIPVRLDDNIFIPLFFGLVYSGLLLIF